jgi:hypothetical protein
MNTTTRRILVSLAALTLVAGCGPRGKQVDRPRRATTGGQVIRTVQRAIQHVLIEAEGGDRCPTP